MMRITSNLISQKNKITPAVTFPWAFPSHSYKKFLVQFGRLVKNEKLTEKYLEPYFTGLEQIGVTPNKFAFYTLRSFVHYQNANKTGTRHDPLNNGFFILGGGEEQKDLYNGSFTNVKVLHDMFYNVNFKAVQVEGCPAIPAKQIPAVDKIFLGTNAIIDSGTSFLALATDVYNGILQSFHVLNPAFQQLINQSENGVPVWKLNLSKWPNIHFIFTGDNGKDVKLTCTPHTYWQENYPEFGKAVFQIGGGETQSIFGLPLLNNY